MISCLSLKAHPFQFHSEMSFSFDFRSIFKQVGGHFLTQKPTQQCKSHQIGYKDGMLPAERRICCSAIATSQGSCVATTMVLSGSKERMLESTCLAVELSTPAEGSSRRRMHGDV